MVIARIEPVTSKVPRMIDHIISVDVEDDTRGNLILACVYGTYLKRKARGKEIIKVEQTFRKREDLSAFLNSLATPNQLFTPCVIVGFNIDYDMAYFDDAVDYSKVLYAGTRFIAGELLNGIPIIDVFNHGGGRSLDAWITELKLNQKGIYKTEWRADMTDKELEFHCQNDVRAHWEVADFFRKTYEDIGVPFKTTTSATALNLFKRYFMQDRWIRDTEKFNEYERLAYYGGRTECFSRGKFRIKSYDINSAYVSVMATEDYPKPDTAQRYPGSKGFRHYYNDREHLMIVHCKVFAPKSRVMVLPYNERNEKGEKIGKLIFPSGVFKGVWCSPELKKAEEYGYKILKVYSYIIYRKKHKYFSGYARYTWDQRKMYAEQGNDGMKTVWKLMGNGLYGKLAQSNPRGGGFSTTPQTIQEGDRPIIYIAKNGQQWFMNDSTKKDESINSFPCVSAFITCYTRLKLLEYLKRHEKTVVYCDTDSIKIPWNDEQEVSSSELGGVKYEDEHSGWFCFLKPKLYGRIPKSFTDVPDSYDFLTPLPHMVHLPIEDGDTRWKIKGVGKYKWCYFNLARMVFKAEFTKPHRFKESIRRKLTRNEWAVCQKELDILDDKRTWLGKDSEPLTLKWDESSEESKPLLPIK